MINDSTKSAMIVEAEQIAPGDTDRNCTNQER